MSDDYNRMSSMDMAKALDKYGGRVSKGLLQAISARLVRNAKLLKGFDHRDAEHRPYLEVVERAAKKYVQEPTNANFVELSKALDDVPPLMQCVRAKALYDAALVISEMQGCPPGNCTGVAPLSTCDGSPRADCWYGYLKEGLRDE